MVIARATAGGASTHGRQVTDHPVEAVAEAVAAARWLDERVPLDQAIEVSPVRITMRKRAQ